MFEQVHDSLSVPPCNFTSMDTQQQQQKSVESVATQQNVIKLKLVPIKSPDVNNGNVIASLVVVNDGTNGNNEEGNGLLPFIDEATVTALKTNQLQNASKEGPRLRYYAVGPSTYSIKCPLCEQKGNACVMRGCGLKDATCCLSLLSCIYPIFWLCCLFTCCSCHNSGWYTKGLYCSQCGGKLGKLKNRQ